MALTYREYYLEQSRFPPANRVAAYLASYRYTDACGAGFPTPAALRDQTVALSNRHPLAFLYLTPGVDGTNKVAIVHRFIRYVDAPGEEATGFNERVLGLLGDLLPHQYPAVEIPGTAFHLVGIPARVPTVEAMIALLPTWENA